MAEVYQTLPDNVMEQRKDALFQYREAVGMIDNVVVHFYHCRTCGGWLKGFPIQQTIYTLSGLTGRSGVVFKCAHCGEEVGFFGCVA